MTDPRIVECAKALEESINSMGDRGQPPLDLAVAASACILKWLEQPPTENMRLAGEPYCPYADDSWKTMSDIAVIEISGVAGKG